MERSTETIRLVRDGEKGEGVWRWRKREIIYLSLHCRHQNDSCIKMGSDDSHFNVSSVVRDKVTRLSTNQNLFEEKGEPRRNRVSLLLTSLTPFQRPFKGHRLAMGIIILSPPPPPLHAPLPCPLPLLLPPHPLLSRVPNKPYGFCWR